MSEDFNWNDFAGGGDFIKFETEGDTIVGEIVSVTKGTDFNGAPCPKLTIRTDDGDDKIVNAGQVVLQNRLAEVTPRVGERIGIVYEGPGKAQPGKTAPKLFTITVRGLDGVVRQAPAASSAPTPAPAPASAPNASTGSLV